MTRETKIGLLVGLAFIIIVGILLSEPLSRSSEIQPAALPGVGPNVRSAVATPGAANNPPISMQQAAVTPPTATPQQTVPTQQEVGRQRGGIGVVIGPGANNPVIPQPERVEPRIEPRGEPRAEPRVDPRREVAVQTPPAAPPQAPRTLVGPRTGEVSIGTGADAVGPRPVERTPEKRVTTAAGPGIIVPQNQDGVSGIEADPLTRVAKAVGEELEPFGKPRVAQPNGGNNGRPASNAKKVAQEYEVQAGDSLGKIAAKFYGSSAKPYQDAIVNANPSLKGDRNKILVGVAYVIPPVDTTTPAAPAAPQPAAPAPPQLPAVQPASAKVQAPEKGNSPEHFYTVKSGDTLWAIARDQVGDPNAVAAIKELNKDALKGSDGVRAGMKLRMPAKPLASAN